MFGASPRWVGLNAVSTEPKQTTQDADTIEKNFHTTQPTTPNQNGTSSSFPGCRPCPQHTLSICRPQTWQTDGGGGLVSRVVRVKLETRSMVFSGPGHPARRRDNRLDMNCEGEPHIQNVAVSILHALRDNRMSRQRLVAPGQNNHRSPQPQACNKLQCVHIPRRTGS